jgi:hypothetical protein
MSSERFKSLKETAAERFAYLKSLVRPDLGSHKKTRLIQAGCCDSGSILHGKVSEEHAALLTNDFHRIFGQSDNQSSLRFVTFLHTVVPVDTKRAIDAVTEMEGEIHRLLASDGLRFLGAVEVEVVNLDLMRRINASKGDQARKLKVLERLVDPVAGMLNVGLLIHIHGVLDLRNSILQDGEIRDRLQQSPFWSRSGHQVEVKSFFAKNSTKTNLANIAAYITKGGNETLRYNPGFGRDPVDQLEASIWRQGLGRKEYGADTVTDERALAFSEIATLDQIWQTLMGRSTDGRGYIVSIGEVSVVSSYDSTTRQVSYNQSTNELNRSTNNSNRSTIASLNVPYGSQDPPEVYESSHVPNEQEGMISKEQRIEAMKGVLASLFACQRTLKSLDPRFKWAGLGNLLGDYGEFIVVEAYGLTPALCGSNGYDAGWLDVQTQSVQDAI